MIRPTAPCLRSSVRRRSASGLVALLAMTATAHAGSILYVDADVAGGAGDGSSWGDAFGGTAGVQDALAAAAPGDTIWVAAGTYLPTDTGSRSISFALIPDVALYGGFAGGETMLDQREPAANPTILSGDLQGDDVGGVPGNDNSFHVITAQGGLIDADAIVSGFVVRGGNANGGADPSDRGGGMFIQNGAAPTFDQCDFDGNRCTFGGGAGYVRNASPTYVDCTFRNGNGGAFGGAFDIFSSGTPAVVRFERCRVLDNRAGRAGGIEAFGNVTVTLVNTLIAGNFTTGEGGGMFVANGADAFIESSTIAANQSSGNTGGVHLAGGGTAAIDNTILWGNTDPSGGGTAGQLFGGNPVLRHCVIEGGWSGAGTGNRDGDPMLVDPASGDPAIGPGSSAADAGDNTLLPPGTLVDLTGAARFADDVCATDDGVPGGDGGSLLVDIGAAERTNGSADCNANGTLDECEIASGAASDCNGNGIPDSCDIDAGADDCNANGVPDACEVASEIAADTGPLGPIGSGSPQSAVLPATAEAVTDVLILLEASADLEVGFEVIEVSINGTSLGNTFSAAGNCASPPSTDELMLTAAAWNDLVPAGTSAVITFTANGAVDPTDCNGQSFVQAVVGYTAAGSNDADADGVPDDCDGTTCPGNVNGDGAVDFTDLLSVLGNWGPCDPKDPCDADLDASGTVDFTDLLTVLGNWGVCPG